MIPSCHLLVEIEVQLSGLAMGKLVRHLREDRSVQRGLLWLESVFAARCPAPNPIRYGAYLVRSGAVHAADFARPGNRRDDPNRPKLSLG